MPGEGGGTPASTVPVRLADTGEPATSLNTMRLPLLGPVQEPAEGAKVTLTEQTPSGGNVCPLQPALDMVLN